MSATNLKILCKLISFCVNALISLFQSADALVNNGMARKAVHIYNCGALI